MTVHTAIVRCRVDLPNRFRAKLGTHSAGDFFPRKRYGVEVFDNNKKHLQLVFLSPLDHFCGGL